MNVEAHPIGIILQSMKTVDGVRFSMSRDHWKTNPAVFRKLPATVFGASKRWVAKKDNKLTVDWESDALSSTEYLEVHPTQTPRPNPHPHPRPGQKQSKQ